MLSSASSTSAQSRVDDALRTPFGERRTDLYRPQSNLPAVHPNGYSGPGLRLRDGQLIEGHPVPYDPRTAYPSTQFYPGTTKEGRPKPLDPNEIGPGLYPVPSCPPPGAPSGRVINTRPDNRGPRPTCFRHRAHTRRATCSRYRTSIRQATSLHCHLACRRARAHESAERGLSASRRGRASRTSRDAAASGSHAQRAARGAAVWRRSRIRWYRCSLSNYPRVRRRSLWDPLCHRRRHPQCH